MTTNTVSRRKIYINKSFQGRFIAWVIAMIILFGFCSAFLLYWLIGSDLDMQSQSAHVNIENTWQRLGLSILIGNVIAAVIAGLMTIMVVLYISHKIAGPLYRLETLFTQVGDGELNISTNLREKDQLQELVSAFKVMVEKLRKRRQQQQDIAKEILEYLESIDANNAASGIDQLRSKVKELENAL